MLQQASPSGPRGYVGNRSLAYSRLCWCAASADTSHQRSRGALVMRSGGLGDENKPQLVCHSALSLPCFCRVLQFEHLSRVFVLFRQNLFTLTTHMFDCLQLTRFNYFVCMNETSAFKECALCARYWAQAISTHVFLSIRSRRALQLAAIFLTTAKQLGFDSAVSNGSRSSSRSIPHRFLRTASTCGILCDSSWQRSSPSCGGF